MAVKGTIKLSGDKSISHRAILISSIINGESRINNISRSQDVKSTIDCLVKCGIKKIEQIIIKIIAFLFVKNILKKY